MGLNVITGRSGSGKTAFMLNEIIEKIESGTDENIILIVPEQMSFQAEYAITQRLKGKTVSNLQVLGFKRLAYRIFLEVGGANKQFISDRAIVMMLTKILLDQKDYLKVYHRISPNYNFISMVYDVLKEFKSYAHTPESLQELLTNDQYDPQLKDKIHDFLLIFNELTTLYGDQLRDEEDFYQELSAKILESEYVKGSTVYVDGYHGLTGVEMNVLVSLIQQAKSVNLILSIDQLDKPHKYFESDHLFHPVYRMASKLFERCEEEKIEVNIVRHLSKQTRYPSDELAFLEQTFEQTDVQYQEDVTDIKVFECMRPESEVHQVARIIYEELLKGASLSDFVVYTNNEQVYYPLIKNIFKLYHLPVFIDDGEKMLDHSLLNFVDAVLEVVKTNYRHEAMFRAIKTEMFMPLEVNGSTVTVDNYPRWINRYREQLDELENYCLAHGINYEDWIHKSFTVDFNRSIHDRERVKTDEDLTYERMLEGLKTDIMTPLKTFVDRFRSKERLKEKIHALYDLLVDVQVEEKLALYEAIDQTRSESLLDLERVKKHKQVYNKLMELFDELVLVCGDYEVDTDAFIKILQNGFKAMTFNLVPPALEQIMIGNLKRSRFELLGSTSHSKHLGVKKAFILGVNEGEFPRVYQEKGLITNKEREILIENGFECDETVEQAFLDETFYIYKAMTSASETLYLSYSLSGEDKKANFRSFIIDDLLGKFPKLAVQTVYDFPDESIDPTHYISTPEITTMHLLEAFERQRKGERIHPDWMALYHYYRNNPTLRRRLFGLFHKNTAEDLTEDDVKDLYGESLTVSISSLERYNACPYAYFLEKGLSLKERDIKKVEVMDIGNLYHETLKALTLQLMKENKELHELDIDTIERIVHHQVERLAKNVQRDFFSDNERNRYLLEKIKSSLLHSIEAMRYQSKHSKFKVFAVEEKFGKDAQRLLVPERKLPNGMSVQFKGFIDRIDYSEANDQTFVRIIDYKSGSRQVDFSKIYHRLSLQLFAYLDVVIQNSASLFPEQEVIPAGVLYYQIFSSRIQADQELSLEAIQAEHQKEYRMSGYTLADKEVSLHFDTQLEAINRSDIVPIALTKTGFHKSHSKVLDETAIDTVRQYTRTVIEESVQDIIQGKIDIEPVRFAKEPVPCQYCAFRAVCKHDVSLSENRYRIFDKFKNQEEALEKMKERIEGGDAHEVE